MFTFAADEQLSFESWRSSYPHSAIGKLGRDCFFLSFGLGLCVLCKFEREKTKHKINTRRSSPARLR